MFRLPKSSNQPPAKRSPVVKVLQNNQGLCKFPHRKCNLLTLENYDYCLKHILEDKTAPYRPCPFLYTVSGKKCGKPAYRSERKDTWFCTEHSRKTQLIRLKASSRHKPPLSQESLLVSLAHYVPPESSTKKKESDGSSSKQCSQAINPFVDIDAAQVNTRCSQVLDYMSDSDSDDEPATLDSVWRDHDLESSDAESVDSQAEDPLKHAGVYTAEEVTIIIKDKMIRLQSLYIDQFRRLQHLLKERRRKYLHALKKEKETMCSIHDQEKTSAKEQKLYQKLKSLNHYHKYYGEEAVLHKKALEKRAQATEGSLARTSHKGKCAFTEGGVKCGAKTLPGTKYCRKHILEDTQQVLFRACGVTRNDNTCMEPTLNVFENAVCVYHTVLPTQPHKTSGVKEELKPDVNSQSLQGVDVEYITPESVKSEVPSDQKSIKPIDLITDNTDLSTVLSASTSTVNDQIDSWPAGSSSVNTDVQSTSHCLSTAVDSNIGATGSSVVGVLEPSNSIPPELVSPDESPLEVDAQTTPIEPTKEINADEKMDIDFEEVLEKHELEKPTEVVDDELVMVDMMSDVGVVEEVLESEGKPDSEESGVVGESAEVIAQSKENL